MTPNEIHKIDNNAFDYLWDDVWSHRQSNTVHTHEEYLDAKKKFEILKNNTKNANDVDLKYFIKNGSPVYDQPEWGFPKGRRSGNETDLQCAIREFEEETGLNDGDYVVVTNVEPIIEDIIGTNGIKYRHKYFIAIVNTQKKIHVEKSNISQISEIGDIGTYNIDDALNKIREYHAIRKRIIYMVFLYVVSILLKNTNIKNINAKSNVKNI